MRRLPLRSPSSGFRRESDLSAMRPDPLMTIDELSESFYEDLNGHIVTVGMDDAEYRVFFECDDWRDYTTRRRFEIIFEDVAEVTVSPSGCGFIQASGEHPLLWQHNADSFSMFLSSAPSEPFEVLGRIYEAHARLLAGWREMSDYWHADSQLLLGGFGLLADGPRPVIDEYAKVISGALCYSIVHSHRPSGGYRLALFDKSYVIFRRVSVIEHGLASS